MIEFFIVWVVMVAIAFGIGFHAGRGYEQDQQVEDLLRSYAEDFDDEAAADD